MIGVLLTLYPAQWRRRYGEEFRAVLESRPLGPFDVADVVLGALDARLMRFRFAGTAGMDGGRFVMLRVGGFGAVVGGALWFVSMIVANALRDQTGMWILGGAGGTIGLLLALIGLSAFQAHRDPVLAWVAFAIPGIGAIVSVIGLVGMAMGAGDEPIVLGVFSAWALWALGFLATVVGSIFFAAATIRAEVLSRRAAQALGISSIAVLVVGLGFMSGGDSATVVAQLVFAVSLGSFAASWVALGVQALRSGPIRAIAPA